MLNDATLLRKYILFCPFLHSRPVFAVQPPLKVQHHLLHLLDVHRPVCVTPATEVFEETPVLTLLPFTDASHHCSVVRELLQLIAS